MELEKLADQLIAMRCGTHSLGLVYEFLLKTYGNPNRARADFVRFLSGELPGGLLEEAELWVSEEQEWECVPPGDTLSQVAVRQLAVKLGLNDILNIKAAHPAFTGARTAHGDGTDFHADP